MAYEFWKSVQYFGISQGGGGISPSPNGARNITDHNGARVNPRQFGGGQNDPIRIFAITKKRRRVMPPNFASVTNNQFDIFPENR